MQACEELFLPYLRYEQAPGVVHIATHGFALSADTGARNAPENAFAASDNNMSRTGLVLAGANHAWLGSLPWKGLEDGILTAYEVSQMDFSKTELVALSACESGLGEVRGAEGVLGLQRAFKIAGAHYLVLSLWQVPDQETQEFMSLFYKKWLLEKKPVQQAFRATQAEMRRLYPSPYFWAGFVLVE
jgi:CHAT domain-containing protein